MANFRALLLVVAGLVLLVSEERTLAADFNFYRDMSCYWGPQNLAVWNNGQNFALSLNNISGMQQLLHV